MATNFLSLRNRLTLDPVGSTLVAGAIHNLTVNNRDGWTTTLANPFTGSSILGSTLTTRNLTTTGNLTVIGQQTTVPTRYIEMGSDQANSVYFDFHSNDSVVPDYSTRIQSYTGSTIGSGVLTLYGSTIGVNTASSASQFALSTTMTTDLGGALKSQFTTATQDITQFTATYNGTITGPSSGEMTLTNSGNAVNSIMVFNYAFLRGATYQVSITMKTNGPSPYFYLVDHLSTPADAYIPNNLGSNVPYTSTYATYTMIFVAPSSQLGLSLNPGQNATYYTKWNALTIQRFDAIPPSLGYGAMGFQSNDTGLTSASFSGTVQGTITGPVAGAYTLTINSTYTFASALATFPAIPSGTTVQATFRASSLALTSFNLYSSGSNLVWVCPGLTGSMQTFTVTFVVPAAQVMTDIALNIVGVAGQSVSWDSFSMKIVNGGNTLISGNVGIGTTNPSTANLQLGQGLLADLGSGLRTKWTDIGVTAGSLVVNSGGTITGTGPYAFTTNAVNGSLRVVTSLTAGCPYSVSITCNIGSGTGYLLVTDGVGSVYTSVTLPTGYQVYTFNAIAVSGGQLYFQIIGPSGIVFNYNALSIKRMDTNATGRVGVGTTVPAAPLHVTGPYYVGGWPVLGATTNSIFMFSDPGKQYGLNMTCESNTGYCSIQVQRFDGTPSAYALQLNPVGGNVGIGSTATPTSTLHVFGSLAKSSGTFDIPHPLHPGTKRLVHSFIEGPRCDLIYRGIATLVAGIATIDINKECTHSLEGAMEDGTFEALCANPQFFLQNTNGFDRVIGSISGAILTITSENPAATSVISWMVVAERADPFIKEWNRTDNDGYLVTEYVAPVAADPSVSQPSS